MGTPHPQGGTRATEGRETAPGLCTGRKHQVWSFCSMRQPNRPLRTWCCNKTAQAAATGVTGPKITPRIPLQVQRALRQGLIPALAPKDVSCPLMNEMLGSCAHLHRCQPWQRNSNLQSCLQLRSPFATGMGTTPTPAREPSPTCLGFRSRPSPHPRPCHRAVASGVPAPNAGTRRCPGERREGRRRPQKAERRAPAPAPAPRTPPALAAPVPASGPLSKQEAPGL